MEVKKISCNIIEDLLPSYTDGICSKETGELVEEHIADCDKCRSKLSRMRAQDPKLNMPGESEDVLLLTERLKNREKKQKRTSGILVSISAVLAVCLIISVIPKGNTITPAGNDTQQVAAEAEPSDSDEPVLIGMASEPSLGDFTAAADYGQIYDHLNKMYGERRQFDYGDILFNAATTDAVAEESVESMAAGAEVSLEAPMEMKEEAVMDMDVAQSSEAGAGSDTGFSSTNIMTEGVDESDISKTDGSFIYNATGSEIIIFDIREGEAEEICRLTPDFKAPSDIIREIFIDGEIMSVITEHAEITDDRNRDQTIVLVYDISNRKAPEFSGSYRQDGQYKTSRKTGDIIYLFTNKYLEDPGEDKEAALKDENISGWFPTINDEKIDASCVYLPKTGTTSLVMASFNQKSPTWAIDAKVIVNDYVDIYVGPDSIYLYNQTYTSGRDILKISKLSYGEGHFKSGQSTSVRGYLNDSFAINEYDGYLRLVTTEWDGGMSNMLYVFDSDMKECGRINNIANGESLYACRFMGKTGYFVTYEQTDPLFTVDLSDPNNPEIIGELKLLGFSEYLHFWGEDKLLGIGYESDEQGQRKGLKMSMFDISDPSNVTEEAKLVIKDGDYAPGFYNYKSILASPKANLIGFAYYSYEDWDDAVYEVYSYEDNSFTKTISEKVGGEGIDRVRGHYSGDWIYVSQNTTVTSHNYK